MPGAAQLRHQERPSAICATNVTPGTPKADPLDVQSQNFKKRNILISSQAGHLQPNGLIFFDPERFEAEVKAPGAVHLFAVEEQHPVLRL